MKFHPIALALSLALPLAAHAAPTDSASEHAQAEHAKAKPAKAEHAKAKASAARHAAAKPAAKPAAKHPAAKASAPAKAPAARKAAAPKNKKAPAAKTAKKAAATPAPEPGLTGPQLETARHVYTGAIQCELGASVTVTPDAKRPGYFQVALGKRRYDMHPVETTTGAIRMEDPRAEAMWLQVGSKSMLMDQKRHQRLADECATPAQREHAAQLNAHPEPSLLQRTP